MVAEGFNGFYLYALLARESGLAKIDSASDSSLACYLAFGSPWPKLFLSFSRRSERSEDESVSISLLVLLRADNLSFLDLLVDFLTVDNDFFFSSLLSDGLSVMRLFLGVLSVDFQSYLLDLWDLLGLPSSDEVMSESISFSDFSVYSFSGMLFTVL
jgi:hypothetical protein